MSTSDSVADVAKAIEGREEEAIGRWTEWLRIPSISTDPAYSDDVKRAAEWAAAHLRESGIDAELTPTAGHPIVWAEHPGSPDYKGPQVLFYGHYDVQPPDPLDLWESPPFEPVRKAATGEGPGDRVVARGAVDDKGQVSSFLEAMRLWHDIAGSVPMRVTILLEGEEESGSVNLEKFVRDNAEKLRACDICVISDTGMLDRGEPAITYGVRGLSYNEVTLHGPDQDLHSGMWGGRCPNPINELARVLAQLWDEQRRVTIPGFYDDVVEPTPEERKAWANLPLDYPSALKKIGLSPEADIGEDGWTAMEREWARPTCDINGIWGGYTGAGAKTVIAAQASAKLSCRLVPSQDPNRIFDNLKAFLEERTPPDCRWEITTHGLSPAIKVASDSPFIKAAGRGMNRVFSNETKLIGCGGSIPVVGSIQRILGFDSLLVGFGLEDDRVHSPNEKFELTCYRNGIKSHVAMLPEFVGVKG